MKKQITIAFLLLTSLIFAQTNPTPMKAGLVIPNSTAVTKTTVNVDGLEIKKADQNTITIDSNNGINVISPTSQIGGMNETEVGFSAGSRFSKIGTSSVGLSIVSPLSTFEVQDYSGGSGWFRFNTNGDGTSFPSNQTISLSGEVENGWQFTHSQDTDNALLEINKIEVALSHQTATGSTWMYVNGDVGLGFQTSGSSIAYLRADNLTTDPRTLQAPDSDGTIALVETTTLQAVTSVAGGTSTNQHLYFNSGFSASEMDVDGGGTATVSPTTASLEVSKTDGNYGQVTTLGESVTMKSGNSADAIGMVETSTASVRLGTYTDTSDSELFVYGNSLNYTVNDGSGEAVLNFNYAQGLGIVTNAAGEFLNIKSDNVTGTRTLQAPDESGTIATVKYKSYVAILRQVSTSAPTATVLENSIGALTYNYDGAGSYNITCSGLFTLNKTVVIINQTNPTWINTAVVADESDSQININTREIQSPNDYEDNVLYDTTIEIRVYP